MLLVRAWGKGYMIIVCMNEGSNLVIFLIYVCLHERRERKWEKDECLKVRMRYTRINICMLVYMYVKLCRCLGEFPHKCLRLSLLSTLFLVPLLPSTPHAPMHAHKPTLSLNSLTLCSLSGYPVRWKEWQDVWSHIHRAIEIHLTTNNSDSGSVWRHSRTYIEW